MDEAGGPARPMTPDEARATRLETISYIRQMLGELRAIADGADCAMLCYLIEMAYIEAGDLILEARDSDGAVDERYRSSGMTL